MLILIRLKEYQKVKTISFIPNPPNFLIREAEDEKESEDHSIAHRIHDALSQLSGLTELPDSEQKCAVCAEVAGVLLNGDALCSACSLQEALRRSSTLTSGERSKLEELNEFNGRVGSVASLTKLIDNKITSKMASIDEEYTRKAKSLNLMFSVILESIKEQYSKFVDKQNQEKMGIKSQIKAISKTASRYKNELSQISNDIRENYANIILNMEIAPFKEIMLNYSDNLSRLLISIKNIEEEIVDRGTIPPSTLDGMNSSQIKRRGISYVENSLGELFFVKSHAPKTPEQQQLKSDPDEDSKTIFTIGKQPTTLDIKTVLKERCNNKIKQHTNIKEYLKSESRKHKDSTKENYSNGSMTTLKYLGNFFKKQASQSPKIRNKYSINIQHGNAWTATVKKYQKSPLKDQNNTVCSGQRRNSKNNVLRKSRSSTAIKDLLNNSTARGKSNEINRNGSRPVSGQNSPVLAKNMSSSKKKNYLCNHFYSKAASRTCPDYLKFAKKHSTGNTQGGQSGEIFFRRKSKAVSRLLAYDSTIEN